MMARCNAYLSACQFSSGDLDEGFPVKNLVACSTMSSRRPTKFADLYLYTLCGSFKYAFCRASSVVRTAR